MNQTATNAVKAERDRIAAIVALPEAKGREDQAMTLAMTTDLSVDQVRAKFAAETSALWDGVLASRGMKTGEAAAGGASPWDSALRATGMV